MSFLPRTFGLFFLWVLATILASESALAQDDAAYLAAQTDQLFTQWDKPDSPGCALGVIQDGQFLYKNGYGSANLDWDIPITTSTAFYMASLSKQFVAAAIVLLAQDGRLSLEDDIRTYLPELPEYEHTVTIRHLIHHTGGIRNLFPLLSVAGISVEDLHSIEDILEVIVREPLLDFEPGTEHRYSNSGYQLLGVIVERASGKSLREFAHERIFAPLGMRNTHFHEDWTRILNQRAMSYAPREAGGFSQTYLGTLGYGMYTTVEDLLHWDRNFSEPKVGGQEFVDLLLTRGVLANGDTLNYAFGLRVEEYGRVRVVHHDGNFMGFKHYLLRVPENRLSVICLCNLRTIDAQDLAAQVAELYGAWGEDDAPDQFKRKR
ncbi:MAG: beta-lactamase family protein [Bacteroidetes bacterium]|nr:beta-lactamase family protein [Bacteroidota bacterium]